MNTYNSFVYDEYLISPENSHRCKRLTKQNIKKFGFDSIEGLHEKYPGFPLLCKKLSEVYKASSIIGNKKAVETNKLKRVIKNCKQCNKEIPSKNKSGIFCSRSCSGTYNNKNRILDEKSKNKRIKTIKERYKNLYLNNPTKCHICETDMPYEHRKRIRCEKCKTEKSRLKKDISEKLTICKCGNRKKSIQKYCGSCKTNISHYRSLCSFKFNIYEYPEEFDLSLVEDHGWYSPNGYGKRNKITNMSGVSRDHLYSVSSGFNLNKDPKIISHPANCAIMLHNGPQGNNSKNSNSSITWENLLDRIELWEKKYGGPPKT